MCHLTQEYSSPNTRGIFKGHGVQQSEALNNNNDVSRFKLQNSIPSQITYKLRLITDCGTFELKFVKGKKKTQVSVTSIALNRNFLIISTRLCA